MLFEPDLAEKEINERLALLSTPVFSRSLDCANRALELERQRGATIETKTSTLLGPLGLASSLILVFGLNVFVQNRTAFMALGRRPWQLFQMIYGSVAICGVLNGAAAVLCSTIDCHARFEPQSA